MQKYAAYDIPHVLFLCAFSALRRHSHAEQAVSGQLLFATFAIRKTRHARHTASKP